MPVAAANFMDVYANGTVKTGSNITVVGHAYNYSNVSQGMENITTVMNFSTYNGTINSSGTGLFNYTFAAPSGTGEHNISVVMGSTTKTLTVYVTNMSTGTIEYINSKPPFLAGERFTINVTIKNATGSLLPNNPVLLEIYSANGAKQSWTVANLTNSAVHNGKITYNITIGSNADGNYMLSIERGALTSVFSVRSSYIMALGTQSSSGETKSDFYPGSNVTVIAKLRDADGNPMTASSITALVTLPNGSVTTYAMRADANNAGYYNVTYTTNENQSGQYDVNIIANVSGQTVKSSSFSDTQSVSVRLDTQKDFFKEWGGSAAFTAGGDAGLNIIVTNLSNDAVITGAMGGGASYVNCSSIRIVSAKNAVNGSSINLGSITNTTGMEMMTSVCRIMFTAPSESGFYSITVNVTVGTGIHETGIGYFSAQKFILKPEPVSSLGGEMEFLTMLYPGDNTTFTISAYNLTSGVAVLSTDIRGINITKITPLQFMTGATDITNITYSVTYATDASADNTVSVALPENRTGPFVIKIRANISGDVVEGEVFYMAKYVMGFLMSGGGGGKAMGGGPMEGGMGGMSSCRGTETLSGSVFQIKGRQSAASGVIFNNILEARNEMTGQDVKSCLTMTKNTSDTNGQVKIPLAFSSSCSYSGFHFMILNVTYEGKSDMIPSGFECKNFMFWPSPDSWRKSSSSSIQFNVTGIRRLNDTSTVTSGTFTLVRAMNFNPGTGGKPLTPANTLTVNLTAGSASLTVFPSNFTGITTWPSGFIDLTWRVCDSTGVCDTSFGGFQISPFDTWVESLNGQYNVWGQTVGAGQNSSFVIRAATNISRNSGNYSGLGSDTTTTGFVAKLGKPWMGKLTTLTVKSAVLLEDGWNNTNHTMMWGFEKWNVTVEIPASTKKGENMISFEVNGSSAENNWTGESTNSEIWFQIGTYTVKTADQVTANLWSGGSFYSETSPTYKAEIYGAHGINLDAFGASTYALAGSRIVAANSLILQRQGGGGGSQTLNNVKIAVIENRTAGNYLVILNVSGTAYALAPTQNWSDLYFWKADEIAYLTFINATAERTSMGSSFSMWGGEYQKGSTFYMPYVVLQAGTNQPMSGMNVTINGLITQNDKGGESGASMGGMGFKDKLTEGTHYSVVQGRTDANGVAFVRLNVTQAGKVMAFWKLAGNGVTDIANFNSGTMMAIRAFKAWGSMLQSKKDGAVFRVTLRRLNTSDVSNNVWNYTEAVSGTYVYNGTFSESSDADFIQDGSAKTYWFIYNPNTNKTLLNDDSNMNTSNQIAIGAALAYTSLNSTLSMAEQSVGVAAFSYSSNNQTLTMALYTDSNTYNWKSVSSATEKISLKVCAYSYDRAQTPKEGATFYVSFDDWSQWPSTTGNLTLYSPIDGSEITQGTTGPSGCGVVQALRSGGWRNSGIGLKTIVSYGGDNEETYAGNVNYWSG